MSAPEDRERLTTERDLLLRRVYADAASKAIQDLRRLEQDIVSLVRKSDPVEPARLGDRLNRIAKLESQVRDVARATYRGINSRLISLQADLMVDEAQATAETMRATGLQARAVVTAATAAAVVQKGELLVEGAPASRHLARHRSSLVDGVTATLRTQARTENATLTKAVRALRGDRDLGFSNGLMRTYENHASTVVDTGMQAATNTARATVYAASSSTTMVQAINPLDSKTSDICKARAGRVWSTKTGQPLGHGTESFPGPPPWHPNCRTTLIPLAASDTPVRGQTFGGLLDSLPEDRQEELLGPGRYDLWRRNKISMGDLINQAGRPLNLSQLRQRSA